VIDIEKFQENIEVNIEVDIEAKMRHAVKQFLIIV